MPAPHQDHGAIPGRKFCPPQANRGNRILDSRLHEEGVELATQFRQTVREVFNYFTLKISFRVSPGDADFFDYEAKQSDAFERYSGYDAERCISKIRPMYPSYEYTMDKS